MQYKTLDSLCKVASGGTPSRSKKEYWDGGDIPWIKIGNIKSKVVSNADEYITEAGLNNSSAKLFKKGTILYTIFATLGEVGILDFDACTNQAIAGISIEKTEEITTDYLYYYLKSKKAEVNQIGRGVAQNNINLSILRKFSIPMRDIDEQKTIVDSLNKVESIIEKQKRQLEQLDELIKARFVEMFGDIYKSTIYPKQKWNDIVTIRNGKDYKKVSVKGGGYPVYGTGGEMARASEFLCPENTIIVGRKGTINNPMLVREKFWNVDTAFGVIPGDKLHYLYFFWFCKMFDFSRLNKQAVLPSTTKADLLNIEMQVPPIDIQNQFATFVAQVDKSKFALSDELTVCDFYVCLIYDRVMHGRIDLRVS